jgi:AcrR family transcriptional regulator
MEEQFSPRRERKDTRRNLERILRAAHELFAERGADVRMEEIAQRAEVGVGTIYRRFPSKEQLLDEVRAAACLHTRISLLRAAGAAAHPLDRLRAIIIEQYRQTIGQAALLELSPDRTNCEADTGQTGLYHELHTLLSQTISDGQRLGQIRAGTPETLAAICVELLAPPTVLHLSRLHAGCAVTASQQAADFIIAGLAAPAATTEEP